MKTLLAAALAAVALPQADAWSDWGHQLPLAMLKLRARDGNAPFSLDHIRKIEGMQRMWLISGNLATNNSYSYRFEFGGSVMDYLQSDVVLPGMQRKMLDGFFGPATFCHALYEPEDPKTDKGYTDCMAEAKDGAPWMLNHIDKNVLSFQDDAAFNASTAFTVDSYLRHFWMYTTLMIGMHQPCHAASLTSSCAALQPHDNNAQLITLDTNSPSPLFATVLEQSTVTNLHTLWDLGSWTDGDKEERGMRTERLGSYTKHERMEDEWTNLLMRDASDILDAHTKASMKVSLDVTAAGDFTYSSLERESYDVARENVYKALTAKNYQCVGASVPAPFKPDDAYIQQQHATVIKQLATACYRLENAYVRFFKNLDTIESAANKAQDHRFKQYFQARFGDAATSGVAAAVLFALLAQLAQTQP